MEESLAKAQGENAAVFLEEPGEWLDIIGSGGLKKKILKNGIENVRPKRGDEVTINAVGYIESKFSAYGIEVEEFNELTFTLGGGEVVPGFDVAVALMNHSEVAKIFMESRFAYGDLGVGKIIPPGENLHYEITLVEFNPEKSPEELEIEDRKKIGERKRERGNFWFNREEFSQAMMCYKAAVDFLDDTSDNDSVPDETTREQIKSILEMRLKTLNNMAAAQLKLGAFEAALVSLEPVLKCQPNNVKALYRKGKILSSQNKFKEALDVFEIALTYEPQSKLIHGEISKLLQIRFKETENEKSLYRKMFGFYSHTKEQNDRYPSLRGKHLKTLAIAFIVLFTAGIALSAFIKM